MGFVVVALAQLLLNPHTPAVPLGAYELARVARAGRGEGAWLGLGLGLG